MSDVAKIRLPHLRVCLTWRCNFQCRYCKTGGEGGTPDEDEMSADDILAIIHTAADFGIKDVKFTGGEPLLRNDLPEVLARVSDLGLSTEVITNGRLLPQFSKHLDSCSLDKLTISLHTLNESTFRSLSGQIGIAEIKKGILGIASRVSTRINMIVMKLNYDDVWEMIEFAKETQTELKLHELLQYRVPLDSFWTGNYVSLEAIHKRLAARSERCKTVFEQGHYGSPMAMYHLPSGPDVIVWDSSRGSHYGDICNSCSLFPCQDGLYGLRITPDGKVKRCWPRDDVNLDILSCLRVGDSKTASKRLMQALHTFSTSTFRRINWHDRHAIKPSKAATTMFS